MNVVIGPVCTHVPNRIVTTKQKQGIHIEASSWSTTAFNLIRLTIQDCCFFYFWEQLAKLTSVQRLEAGTDHELHREITCQDERQEAMT